MKNKNELISILAQWLAENLKTEGLEILRYVLQPDEGKNNYDMLLDFLNIYLEDKADLEDLIIKMDASLLRNHNKNVVIKKIKNKK
jgi:histone deacetylase complex regulatory component SIN3